MCLATCDDPACPVRAKAEPIERPTLGRVVSRDSGVTGLSVTPPATPVDTKIEPITVTADVAEPAAAAAAAAEIEHEYEFDPNSPGPRLLVGDGSSFVMSPESRAAAMAALSTAWTTSGKSIIPDAAVEHFPAGPTAGTWRSRPKAEKIVPVEETVKVGRWEQVKLLAGRAKRWEKVKVLTGRARSV
jgi:hypothetical protein